MSELATVMRTLPSTMAGKGASKAPGVHEPGIYFGMPEDDYHGSFALSASGIKNLRISTLDFWARSTLNPDREDDETDALRIGRAYHKRIVEGREAFYRCYAAELDPAKYPEALRTVEDLKSRLRDAGLPVTGNKPQLIGRLCEEYAQARSFIWECLIEDHAEINNGKELLPADLIHRIEISAAMIEKHPQLGKAFSGGYPEVSIFWNDHESDVPCKGRLDYLKSRAIVDLKTFENMMGMPVRRAVARAVANGRYHIQAAFYLEAVQEAKRFIDEGRVFGNVDKGFLQGLRTSTEHTFLFVFQQKGIAPLARGYILPPSTVLDIGRMEIDQAKATFAHCWEAFGTDPWLDVSEIETFDTTEFPAYIAD